MSGVKYLLCWLAILHYYYWLLLSFKPSYALKHNCLFIAVICTVCVSILQALWEMMLQNGGYGSPITIRINNDIDNYAGSMMMVLLSGWISV